MAQQTINLGTSANDGLGDNLRSAMDKVNDNFDELYGANSVSSNIALSGNTVSTYATNQDIVLGPDGTGTIRTASDLIPDVTNTRYIGNANVRHLGAYIGTAGLITSGPISLASYANATVRDAEITQPSAGMFIYNQDGTQFQGYSGSEWAIMGGNVTNNVGGADTQVQFNGGGAAFGGDAGLTYNKTTDTLTGVTGTFTTLNADTVAATTLSGTFATLNATTVNASTLSTSGATNLLLNTNGGTNSGNITIVDGTNGSIKLQPDGTGDILLTTDGQVGIGSVASPDTKLHLKSTNSIITLQRTNDAGVPGIDFQASGGDVRAQMYMEGTGGVNKEIIFKIRDDSTLGERFRVQRDGAKVTGNVLVQTDDPNITLRRDDNVKVPGLVWQGAAGTEAASIKLDGTDCESNTIIISSFNGSSVTERIRVKAAGVKVTGNLEVTGAQVDFTALPTSDPGVAGRLYNDSGTVKISAG